MNTESRPVALVTAASSGIGAGIARHLAKLGYRVAVFSRSEAIQTVAQEIGGIAVQGDIRSDSDIHRLVDQATTTWQRIDAVVNNTGHVTTGDFAGLSDAAWQDGFELILASVIRMARHVTPAMQALGAGAIVNVSSFTAAAPQVERPISSVFRAALCAWTRVYAEHCAASKIRVNSILPGYVKTRPYPGLEPAQIPLGRFAEVDEIARVVAFLLSDGASYITGQNLLVDGGMVRNL